MNVREWINMGSALLKKEGVESPERESRVLFGDLLGLRPVDLFMKYGEEVRAADGAAFMERIRKRAAGAPLQHITGNQEFMGISFRVGPDVLIPRPETELLVEQALSLLRSGELSPYAALSGEEWAMSGGKKEAERTGGAETVSAQLGKEKLFFQKEGKNGGEVHLLDLCCGSGAVGVSLAVLWHSARVTLTDISDRALAIARENAEKNGVSGRTEFFRGDLFSPLRQRGIPLRRQSEEGDAGAAQTSSLLYDMILSNPPYIPSADISHLESEVGEKEPRIALDGGRDGMDFYRRIAEEAPEFLREGGILLLEIGFDQRDGVLELIRKAGAYSRALCLKDLAGKDRIILAVR